MMNREKLMQIIKPIWPYIVFIATFIVCLIFVVWWVQG